MSHYKDKSMEHEHNKRQDVQTRQRLRPALVVARQAAKTGHPGKAALHDPSTWQQDEASLRLRQADHLQAYALALSSLGGSLTGVALIDKGQFHMLSRHFLHGCGQLAHLIAVLLIGWREMQRQEISQRIDGQMHFAAFAPFGSS